MEIQQCFWRYILLVKVKAIGYYIFKELAYSKGKRLHRPTLRGGQELRAKLMNPVGFSSYCNYETAEAAPLNHRIEHFLRAPQQEC
jgi:hypothetical protein